MSKTSSKVKRRWNKSHYDTVNVPKGYKDIVRDEAAKENVSQVEYVKQAIDDKRG
jgi:hypothetical protein